MRDMLRLSRKPVPGATDVRADLHNLPQGEGSKWPGASYGVIASDDWGGYRHERAQILDYIRDNQITGLVSLAGDRHAFSAGWLAASLPPKPFAPVGLEFVTGSVSAPGLAESLDHSMTPDKPWAAIFRQSAAAANPEVAPNLDLMDCGGHGYVVIAAHASSLDAELVCIPRPIQRANSPDGGPLRYRVSYRSPLWKAGEKPGLRRTATAGELPLGA